MQNKEINYELASKTFYISGIGNSPPETLAAHEAQRQGKQPNKMSLAEHILLATF